MVDSRDIFFSYHTDSSLDIVRETDKLLSSFSLTGWYAQRDIKATQNYTSVIPDAIAACKLVVVILNRHAIASIQVEREMNLAMAAQKPILMINIDDSPLSKNSIVYVAAATSQVVYISEKNISVLVQKICRTIVSWFQDRDNSYQDNGELLNLYKTSWDGNDLAFFGDEGERSRIDLQHYFVNLFAKEEYDKLLTDTKDKSFLDVGCNTAVQSKMLLDGKPLKHYIGIDREAAALEEARNAFPNGHMYVCDCEAEDFSQKLTQIENELGISGFDIINVSMLLLHTTKPAILIDILSDHLTEDGRLIVLDIDDGFNIAFPDPDGAFDKAVALCFKTEYSGFRHCGRAINKFMSDTDLNDITLHKQGLTTIGMSRKEREAFFDIYFWFILDDLQKMHEENPHDKFIAADYEWMKEHYSSMKNAFKKRDFFFNLGFVLYSSRA